MIGRAQSWGRGCAEGLSDAGSRCTTVQTVARASGRSHTGLLAAQPQVREAECQVSQCGSGRLSSWLIHSFLLWGRSIKVTCSPGPSPAGARSPSRLSMCQVSQTGDTDGVLEIQRLAFRQRVPRFVDWPQMCPGFVNRPASGPGLRAQRRDLEESGPWMRFGSRFRGLSPLILAPVQETWIPVHEVWHADTG